jgi:hypothetical protein
LEKVFERSTNTSYASAANRPSGSEAMGPDEQRYSGTSELSECPRDLSECGESFLNGDPVFGLIAGQTDKRRQRPRIVQLSSVQLRRGH